MGPQLCFYFYPEPAVSFLVHQSLHRHLTLGGGDLETMTGQVNLQSCWRAALAAHATTGSDKKQNDDG